MLSSKYLPIKFPILNIVGSTAVGKILFRQCADTVKRMSLELGGNAAFIVFPSADMSKVVQGIIASKFRNAGQVKTYFYYSFHIINMICNLLLYSLVYSMVQ